MNSFFSWLQEYDKGLLKWASENEIDLNSIKENSLRTGVKFGYPPAYAKAQYPDGYFPPLSATAFLDLQNSKKQKIVAPPDDAP